jgi:uncharacterized repeat protein (TIGR03803 family)
MREISTVQKHSVLAGVYLLSRVLTFLFLAMLAVNVPAETAMQVIYEFPRTNVSNPYAWSAPFTELLEAADGSFFGVSTFGGMYSNSISHADGYIFKISKSGAFTNLFSFSATNGYRPIGGLTRGPDGTLYGITGSGGTNYTALPHRNDYGTIFKYSTKGSLTSLFSFEGTNGSQPGGRLEFGPDGYLYGGTWAGGIFGLGTIFKVSTNGVMVWSFSFDGTNGNTPALGANWKLTWGIDGCLYGTTRYGNTNSADPYYTGNGNLFKITTNGEITPLLYFNGTNGRMPCSALFKTSNGDLWGTTCLGGDQGFGTVFKFSTNGTLQTIASFDGSAGIQPSCGVVQGGDGNFYGLTPYSSPPFTNGTIYRVSTNGALTTLVYLNGTNGSHPSADMTLASDGNLYGAMSDQNGSPYPPNSGTIFRLVDVPILTATHTSTNVLLSWSAFSNAAYRVEYKTSLTDSNWNVLKSNVTGTGSTIIVTDAPAGLAQRFYRTVLLP